MLKKYGKKLLTAFSTLIAVLLSSPVAFAADILTSGESYTKAIFAFGAMMAAGLGVGLGAFGAALGIGAAGYAACAAVGRNPGVQGKIMTTMLVAMAMAESCVIYALVIALILLYANPYLAYFFS